MKALLIFPLALSLSGACFSQTGHRTTSPAPQADTSSVNPNGTKGEISEVLESPRANTDTLRSPAKKPSRRKHKTAQ